MFNVRESSHQYLMIRQMQSINKHFTRMNIYNLSTLSTVDRSQWNSKSLEQVTVCVCVCVCAMCAIFKQVHHAHAYAQVLGTNGYRFFSHCLLRAQNYVSSCLKSDKSELYQSKVQWLLRSIIIIWLEIRGIVLNNRDKTQVNSMKWGR